MRWVGNVEQSTYMRMRRKQNLNRYSEAEEWVYASLRETEHKWTRQVTWGCRIFDFWCDQLGIAVEVDGPEHDIEYDQARDRYNYWRSAILVLRVRNFDDDDLAMALQVIRESESKVERRAGIRRHLGLSADFPMKKVPEKVGLKKAHLDWSPMQVDPKDSRGLQKARSALGVSERVERVDS